MTQPNSQSQTQEVGIVSLAPDANRPGVNLRPALTNFVRDVSAIYGEPLTIKTGTNHVQYTPTGNVSDHWDGHGVDIAATGETLTRLAQAAFSVLGMDPTATREGGLYDIYWTGPGGDALITLPTQVRVDHLRRVQIIFDSDIGGHRNLFHVGIAWDRRDYETKKKQSLVAVRSAAAQADEAGVPRSAIQATSNDATESMTDAGVDLLLAAVRFAYDAQASHTEVMAAIDEALRSGDPLRLIDLGRLTTAERALWIETFPNGFAGSRESHRLWSFRQVCRDKLGHEPEVLRNWINSLRRAGADEAPESEGPERAMTRRERRFERQVEELFFWSVIYDNKLDREVIRQRLRDHHATRWRRRIRRVLESAKELPAILWFPVLIVVLLVLLDF